MLEPVVRDVSSDEDPDVPQTARVHMPGRHMQATAGIGPITHEFLTDKQYTWLAQLDAAEPVPRLSDAQRRGSYSARAWE